MLHRLFGTIALGMVLFIHQPCAQNASDALRFSTFEVGGTGRFVGVGGSLSALGTEFSVLSTNPAGLALYRSSEVVFTPSLALNMTSSQLDGAFLPGQDAYLPQPATNRVLDETRTAFTVNNLGFVVQSTPRAFDFKTMNFGIGFNQLANFNQTFFYEGETVGSIAERWVERANTAPFDNTGRPIDFEAGPAWDAFALFEPNPPDGFVYTDYLQTYDNSSLGVPLLRNQLVRTRGSLNELVFALATNYRERVMFGLTVGVPFLSYRVTREYREVDTEDTVPFFDDLIYEETVNTTGAGVNAKLGVIVRATQAFRLGFAVHTPTAFGLDDEYDLSITYNFTDDQGPFSGTGESDEGLFDYRLRTPWRLFGSAGLLIGQMGFISAEAEWVNYQNARFRFANNPDEELAANDDVRGSLGQVLNLRLGGEVALDLFRLRAGLGLLPSPFDGDDSRDLTFSAGAGVRSDPFFVDLGWRYRTQSTGFIPYGTASAPQQFINNDRSNHLLVLTLGVRY